MSRERRDIPNEDYVWRTRDGRATRLGDMEYSHLQNAVAWAERRAASYAERVQHLMGEALSAEDPKDAVRLSGLVRVAAQKCESLGRWSARFRAELARRDAKAARNVDMSEVEARILAHFEEDLTREVRLHERRKRN